MLKDMAGGKQAKAIKVFAHAIRYLKDHMLNTLEQRGAGIKAKDINWVLTVPAIWEDPAKQFMREAAEEVNMHDFLSIFSYISNITRTYIGSVRETLHKRIIINISYQKLAIFFFLYNRQE